MTRDKECLKHRRYGIVRGLFNPDKKYCKEKECKYKK
jgi:hypothetical protein